MARKRVGKHINEGKQLYCREKCDLFNRLELNRAKARSPVLGLFYWAQNSELEPELERTLSQISQLDLFREVASLLSMAELAG